MLQENLRNAGADMEVHEVQFFSVVSEIWQMRWRATSMYSGSDPILISTSKSSAQLSNEVVFDFASEKLSWEDVVTYILVTSSEFPDEEIFRFTMKLFYFDKFTWL